MKQLKIAVVAIALALPVAAHAGSGHDKVSQDGMDQSQGHGSMPMHEGMPGMDHGSMSEGTVKQINASAGKIMIEHGPLHNLSMPGMTMVFRVQDPSMLDQVKVGDSIQFTAEKIEGKLTVTKIQAAK